MKLYPLLLTLACASASSLMAYKIVDDVNNFYAKDRSAWTVSDATNLVTKARQVQQQIPARLRTDFIKKVDEIDDFTKAPQQAKPAAGPAKPATPRITPPPAAQPAATGPAKPAARITPPPAVPPAPSARITPPPVPPRPAITGQAGPAGVHEVGEPVEAEPQIISDIRRDMLERIINSNTPAELADIQNDIDNLPDELGNDLAYLQKDLYQAVAQRQTQLEEQARQARVRQPAREPERRRAGQPAQAQERPAFPANLAGELRERAEEARRFHAETGEASWDNPALTEPQRVDILLRTTKKLTSEQRTYLLNYLEPKEQNGTLTPREENKLEELRTQR